MWIEMYPRGLKYGGEWFMDQIVRLDQSFKNEVASYPGGENVLNCYLCGTCTAGCPISEITAEFNPRKIMRKILLGMRDEVLNSGEIWRCYQCHRCVSHCPQDVRFADIVRALREISLDGGLIDKGFAAAVEEIDLETTKKRLERVNMLIERQMV
jgi:heterodisulfide reductase subunit C